VTEGIKIDRGGRFYAKIPLEIFTPNKNLANDGFAGGHVAVGLKEPSSHDVPAALLDQLLNSFEQGRFIFLHPLIENRLVVIEDKGFIFFAQVRGGAKGGDRFGGAFFPGPEPYGIEMSVAKQMYSAEFSFRFHEPSFLF